MSSPITRRSIRSMSRTSSIEVKDHRPHYLAAAESEQLARKIGGAFGGFHHLLQIGTEPGQRRLHRVQQHLRVSGDNHQQIVEVVRHAAGQPAHRLQPLRMMQLFFQALAVGYIA